MFVKTLLLPLNDVKRQVVRAHYPIITQRLRTYTSFFFRILVLTRRNITRVTRLVPSFKQKNAEFANSRANGYLYVLNRQCADRTSRNLLNNIQEWPLRRCNLVSNRSPSLEIGSCQRIPINKLRLLTNDARRTLVHQSRNRTNPSLITLIRGKFDRQRNRRGFFNRCRNIRLIANNRHGKPNFILTQSTVNHLSPLRSHHRNRTPHSLVATYTRNNSRLIRPRPDRIINRRLHNTKARNNTRNFHHSTRHVSRLRFFVEKGRFLGPPYKSAP